MCKLFKKVREHRQYKAVNSNRWSAYFVLATLCKGTAVRLVLLLKTNALLEYETNERDGKRLACQRE